GICDSDTTINGDINGDGAPDITLNGVALSFVDAGLMILSSRNTVKGLRLEHFFAVGVRIFHAVGISSSAPKISSNTIQGNIIVGGGAAGILVEAGSTPGFPGRVDNTKILGNLVSAFGTGIGVFTGDAAGSSVDSTTIAGNSSSFSLFSIHLFTNFSAAGSNTSLTNTNVTDNTVSGSIIGIAVNPFAGDYNTLTGVTIARNEVSGCHPGILVEGGDTASNGNLLNVTIKENIVHGNSNPGSIAGIAVLGGNLSSSGNDVRARLFKNVVTDNT